MPATCTATAIIGADKIFYTTGRLTSEMVIKTVRMGIPILISRSGFTAWGVELARNAGLTLIGRARGKRFVALSCPERIVFDQSLDFVPDEGAGISASRQAMTDRPDPNVGASRQRSARSWQAAWRGVSAEATSRCAWSADVPRWRGSSIAWRRRPRA